MKSDIESGWGERTRTSDRSCWTRGLAHTNSIENFWSLFKRSIAGQFHSISVKHMGKYVDETAYKFNRRGTDYFPETVARLVDGTPFPYRTLIETTE